LATALVLAAVAWPGISQATSEDEAMALCREALTSDYGVSNLRDLSFYRHDHRPFVYGDADTADGKLVRFRCLVFEEKVADVDMLEPDPGVTTGHVWVSMPRAAQATATTGETTEATPEKEALHPAEPHFARVK
jgi:hypothetical protein